VAGDKCLPAAQGLVLGFWGKKHHLTALVGQDGIHYLVIGASGVDETAFFLYLNLEYACASGMSFFASDTKDDLAQNYGTIARDCYGYQLTVIDLRNPTRSDRYNLLTLINHYMDHAIWGPDDLVAQVWMGWCIYMYLQARTGRAESCWPANNTITADLHLSRFTVKRALKDLDRVGRLEKQHHQRLNGIQVTNLYTVGQKYRSC